MTKLDWSKRSARRFQAHRAGTDQEQRQQAMQNFVAKHGLTCFRCHQNNIVWAKTGIGEHSGKPWAICTACVQSG